MCSLSVCLVGCGVQCEDGQEDVVCSHCVWFVLLCVVYLDSGYDILCEDRVVEMSYSYASACIHFDLAGHV